MFDFLDDVPAMGDVFGGFSTGGMGGGISGFGGGGGAAPASGPSSFEEVGVGDHDGLGAGGAGGAGGGLGYGGGARGASGGSSPPTQQLDFVANDGSPELDVFAWLTDHDQDRPRTIQEMAASAEAQAGNGQVSQIDLVGHGRPNWQSTGRDDEPGGSVGATMSDDDREAFRRMGATMTPDGEIVFGGCNVAATDDPVMMKQAAAAAGHNVRGGTARQIPFLPGIEGPEVVVMPDGTTRTETNLFKDAYAWADNHVPW
ncbi:MAG: DUF4347 domain-containing protein [Deltaproteobacteria bacterium]|nr:DUF4347 domain-containing protein [Deltaproteobacteria bacterium]